MPALWLPDEAADALIGEAEARRMLDFRKRLRGIDPRLSLMLADLSDPENDIQAGYWYIYRRNGDGTTAFWEVSDPEGRPMEPNDRVLEALRRGDAARGDAKREWKANQARHHASLERERQRKRDEAQGRLKEEFDFAFRIQQPITRKPFGRDS